MWVKKAAWVEWLLVSAGAPRESIHLNLGFMYVLKSSHSRSFRLQKQAKPEPEILCLLTLEQVGTGGGELVLSA